MKTYIVTYAMPGYLPDGMDPASFPSYRKARAYVMEMARMNETRVKPRGITARGHVISWTEYQDGLETGYVWEVYPETVTTPGDRSEMGRYLRYVARCDWESLDAHDIHMWRIHGRPTGPI